MCLCSAALYCAAVWAHGAAAVEMKINCLKLAACYMYCNTCTNIKNTSFCPRNVFMFCGFSERTVIAYVQQQWVLGRFTAHRSCSRWVRTDCCVLFRLTSAFKWLTVINLLCRAFVCLIAFQDIDNIVSIRTGRSGIRIPLGVRDLFLINNVQDRIQGQPNLLFSGYCRFFPGVKRLGGWG
jgi:hypothetical protein